jgi:hypothetical protein
MSNTKYLNDQDRDNSPKLFLPKDNSNLNANDSTNSFFLLPQSKNSAEKSRSQHKNSSKNSHVKISRD